MWGRFGYESIPLKDESKVNISSTSAGYGSLGDRHTSEEASLTVAPKEQTMINQHLELLKKAQSILENRPASLNRDNDLSAVIDKIKVVTTSLAEIKEDKIALNASITKEIGASWKTATALIENLKAHAELPMLLKNKVNGAIRAMANAYNVVDHRHPTYPEQLDKILNPPPTVPTRRVF